MRQTMIEFKLKIMGRNGAPLTAADKRVAYLNFPANTMFSQVQVSLNDTPIYTSQKDAFPYISYIKTLLGATMMQADSTLISSGFTADGPMEGEENHGFQIRAGRAALSRSVHFKYPLCIDFFEAFHHLVPQMKLAVTLFPVTDRFAIYCPTATTVAIPGGQPATPAVPVDTFSIELKGIRMWFKTMGILGEAGLFLEKRFVHNVAKYSYPQWDLKVFAVPANVQTFGPVHLQHDRVMRELYVVFVDADAYHGDFTKDPFYFENCNVRNLWTDAGK